MDTISTAPASCKVRAVIRFLHAEGQSAGEIHCRLCHVYGDNVMSDSSEVDPKQKAQDAY
jgi:cytochrome c-type biogenesis protein CcmH/NrfF